MYKPRFSIWAVGGGVVDRRRVILARDALFHLCMALAKIDYDYLGEFPGTPMLYGSGLRYHDDSHEECWQNVCKTQEDDWADIYSCLKNGYLDCEDAVAWRCAELWKRGIRALPFPVLESEKKGQLWHMLVIWPDGRIEDPSAILGMPTNKNYDLENAKLGLGQARIEPSKVRELVRHLPPWLRRAA